MSRGSFVTTARKIIEVQVNAPCGCSITEQFDDRAVSTQIMKKITCARCQPDPKQLKTQPTPMEEMLRAIAKSKAEEKREEGRAAF